MIVRAPEGYEPPIIPRGRDLVISPDEARRWADGDAGSAFRRVAFDHSGTPEPPSAGDQQKQSDK